MRIKIEDYNGNDLCEINIPPLTDLCEIKELIGCNIADMDEDEQGEYLRIQMEEPTP